MTEDVGAGLVVGMRLALQLLAREVEWCSKHGTEMTSARRVQRDIEELLLDLQRGDVRESTVHTIGEIAISVGFCGPEDDPFEKMIVTKHAGERRIRDAFHERYGAFLKCERCGAYVPDEPSLTGLTWLDVHDRPCGGRYRLIHYSPPPSEGT